jgi:Ca-activated chloride channel family protein
VSLRAARLLVVAALGALMLAPALHAQVFKGGTDVVLLPVTVTERGDKLVGGLDQSAFHVFEDGAPQSISVFSREPQPIALSILLDTSTSMEIRMPVAQTAAIGFARRLGVRDAAQVIAFDSQAQVLQPFTNDHALLERAIRGAHVGGSTSLYMAVYIALSDLEKGPAATPGELRRQAIVLLSDGEDTSSLVDFDQVHEKAKRSAVTVYAIGLKTPNEEVHGFNEAAYVLRSLTQDTGGKAYFVDRTSSLETVYQQIADELANQYMIGYTSTNHHADGAWRHVTVSVDRPGAAARTRSGYYAPRSQQ